MTMRAPAAPSATLIFKTRDQTQSEMEFVSCDHAIVAAMERLSPKERKSAFILFGRVTLNHAEIAQAYQVMVA